MPHLLVYVQIWYVQNFCSKMADQQVPGVAGVPVFVAYTQTLVRFAMLV